jgi:hypothetical protein
MDAKTAHRPPVDVKGAAAYTGFGEGYLNKLRCTGDGPVFIKRAGVVRYDPTDLDAWLASMKRRSTSESSALA